MRRLTTRSDSNRSASDSVARSPGCSWPATSGGVRFERRPVGVGCGEVGLGAGPAGGHRQAGGGDPGQHRLVGRALGFGHGQAGGQEPPGPA